MNLESFTDNLYLADNSIWYSRKDEVEVSYPEEGNANCFEVEDNSFWFKHRNECIKAIIKNYQGRCKPLFDVGGGNGYVAKGLQDSEIPVALVEPGDIGAVNALRRGVKTVICSTLENAGFKKGSLDAVSLFDVVEHIDDDLQFMSSVHSFLRQDGTVFITVPAYQWLWSDEDAVAGHYRRHSVSSVSRLLQNSGFRIEFASYFFCILPVAIFLFRALPYKLGIQKNPNKLTAATDHQAKQGLIGRLLQSLLNFEVSRLSRAKTFSFGASILIVGKKNG